MSFVLHRSNDTNDTPCSSINDGIEYAEERFPPGTHFQVWELNGQGGQSVVFPGSSREQFAITGRD